MKFEITDSYARDELAKLKAEVTQLHADLTAWKMVNDAEKKHLQTVNDRLDKENDDLANQLDELEKSDKMTTIGQKGVDARLQYAAELEAFMGEAFVLVQKGASQQQILGALGEKYPRVILRLAKNPDILKNFMGKFANDALKGFAPKGENV